MVSSSRCGSEGGDMFARAFGVSMKVFRSGYAEADMCR